MKKIGNTQRTLTPTNHISHVHHVGDSPLVELREILREILDKPIVNHILFLLIVSSIVLLILETDAQAVTGGYDDPVYPESPLVMKVLSWILICVFVVETSCRIFVQGVPYFKIGTNLLDLGVVVGDFTLACMEELMTGSALPPSIAFLRCFRLLRLLRMLKVIKRFPELNYLLNGMMSSFRSISWGLVMVFIILLIWSIVAVQLLHDINFRIAGQRDAEGNLDDCERCASAFSSVWQSFITLTQTLVCGDSWGATAIPVILEAPQTMMIFMMAYASVALAALNLILAAIVDSGQQAREDAAEARMADVKAARQQEEEDNFRYLMNLCKEIDDDESGRLSKEEMIKGFQKNRNFAQAMRDMGFEEMDLQVLFPCLDKDSDGAVDYAEFLDLMKKTKMEDTKRMMTFTKFAVMDIWKIVQENSAKIVRKENEITRKEEEIYRKVDQLLAVQALPEKFLQLDGLASRNGSNAPKALSSSGSQQRGINRDVSVEPKQRGTQRYGSMKVEDATNSALPSDQSRGSRSASPGGSLSGRAPARKTENDCCKQDVFKRGAGCLMPLEATGNRLDGAVVEQKKIDVSTNAKKRLIPEMLTATKENVAELQGAGDELVQLMKMMLLQTEAQRETLCNINLMVSENQMRNGVPSLRGMSEAPPEAPLPSSNGTRFIGGSLATGAGRP